MSTNEEIQRPESFVTRWLPWALGGAMLLAFVLTLGRTMSPGNFTQVLELNGLNWSPNIFRPLSHLLFYPFRWLPAAAIPVAANLFSAVCAALTLVLLARSVSLLPHDRTHDQRQREQSAFSILTIRHAWLPPVMAVLVCGFQITFWEQATEAAGEMLDLLLFAYCVRCFLEFRIDGRASWLNRFALVFGLAVANNWGMIGFIPCFLAAVIWSKGLGFFNVRFLTRSLLLWLAGLSLILLMPILAALTHGPAHLDLWLGLQYVLKGYKAAVMSYPRGLVVLVCLTSVLPVFVLSIRWASFFGDTSPLGIFLATSMFHFVHAMFLLACLWVSLDAPISPRMKAPGAPFLTLYYLGALSVGYFSGYFLLVFGTAAPKMRQRLHPLLWFLKGTVSVAVWVLFLGVPGLLLYRNLPRIPARNNFALARYMDAAEKMLPREGAVVLSDDPARLACLEVSDLRKGNRRANLLIDTHSLNYSNYYHLLAVKYPAFKLGQWETNLAPSIAAPLAQIQLLRNLAKEHKLYYLHPSFGIYFEQYYMKPHGLVYELESYGAMMSRPPALSQALVAENEAFWKNMAETELQPLLRAMQRTRKPMPPPALKWLYAKLHLKEQPDARLQLPGEYYARALDYWGVELQKTGAIAEAGRCFRQAHELNPENVSARANSEFNQDLQDGKKPVVKTAQAIEQRFGTRRKWDEILEQDGPFDEPGFCYQLGATLAQSQLFRQAEQLFERVNALAPDQTDARNWIAQLSIITRDYSNSLAMAGQILKKSPDDANAHFLQGLALLQLRAYSNAIPPLSRVLALQTNNYNAQLSRATAYLQLGELDSARQDYATVAQAVPQAYQAYYGLAEIASRRHATAEAIRNYQLYLTNAPPDTDEARQVTNRLQELQSAPSAAR